MTPVYLGGVLISSSNYSSKHFLRFWQISLPKGRICPAHPARWIQMLRNGNDENQRGGEMHMVKLHSTQEVAEYFGVSLSTVIRLIRDGELEAIKIRRQIRISDKAIRNFISAKGSRK